jgi:hypothetical protein
MEVYLDIETTGLSPYHNYITVVGISIGDSSGRGARAECSRNSGEGSGAGGEIIRRASNCSCGKIESGVKCYKISGIIGLDEPRIVDKSATKVVRRVRK